jgi:predicted O-methyltransferase YrrM
VSELAAYYAALGYPTSRWHIGAEHPLLEEYAIRLLATLPCARVLEIGYQAGGFAVPLILAMHTRPDFAYVGVDSMAYGSAVDGPTIGRYVSERGVSGGYEFVERDAGAFLRDVSPMFDLILIDHDKRLYPRDLRTVLRRNLVSPSGVVLLHDVLGKARRVWHDCVAIARNYGWSPELVVEVPEGLAVLRRERRNGSMAPAERLPLWGAVFRILARQLRDRLRASGRGLLGHR